MRQRRRFIQSGISSYSYRKFPSKRIRFSREYLWNEPIVPEFFGLMSWRCYEKKRWSPKG